MLLFTPFYILESPVRHELSNHAIVHLCRFNILELEYSGMKRKLMISVLHMYTEDIIMQMSELITLGLPSMTCDFFLSLLIDVFIL